MKLLFLTIVAILTSLTITSTAQAACKDTYANGTESTSGTCGTNGNPGSVTKSVPVTIYWLDGYQRQITVSDTGQSGQKFAFSTDCPRCWPEFYTPEWEDDGTTAYWFQVTYRATINQSNGSCSFTYTEDHRQGHTCRCGEGCSEEWPFCTGGCQGGGGGTCQSDFNGCFDCTPDDGMNWQNCYNLGGAWFTYPYCSCSDPSPVIIDVAGDGLTLTARSFGVMFDLSSDGAPNLLPWTLVNSDDGWLFLDRNGNGSVDNGTELFGNFTPQPAPPLGEEKNGFLALALYDRTESGGNNNGRIDEADSMFPLLRIWQDRNHNGLSESSELHPLRQLGIRSLDLKYKSSKRVDQYGNEYRYRVAVEDAKGTQLGRWAYDVFLVGQ